MAIYLFPCHGKSYGKKTQKLYNVHFPMPAILMPRLPILLPLLAAALLAACAKPFPAHELPAFAADEVRSYRLDRLDDNGHILASSLLLVQGDGAGGSRWIQTDAFGAPQARLIATTSGWQRDGFVPPNREAERLFEALFPHLHNTPDMPIILPGWRITPVAP